MKPIAERRAGRVRAAVKKRPREIVERIALAGGTPLVVADGHRPLGVIYLKDIVKNYMPAASWKDGYEATVTAIKAHESVMKQAKVPYLVNQTLFGGNANAYVTLTLRDSFADLDKGPVVTQALGQEGAEKLYKNLPPGTVVHLERSLSRFVPELSIMPSPQ